MEVMLLDCSNYGASLPLWKCGLKWRRGSFSAQTTEVTSLVEVWIEMLHFWSEALWMARHFPCGSVDWNIWTIKCLLNRIVTSLVEVWIEIWVWLHNNMPGSSLPLWKCGLKSLTTLNRTGCRSSLPLWKCGLKSQHILFLPYCFVSLPLWKCGLKCCTGHWWEAGWKSLPLWKCGLKFFPPYT